MELTVVSRLCKRSGFIQLIDRPGGEQWLGTDIGLYPLNNLPYMKEEHLPQLLGLSLKQQHDTHVQHITSLDSGMNFKNNLEDEFSIEKMPVVIEWRGVRLVPFTNDTMVLYLNVDYLTPLTVPGESQLYFVRTDNKGTPYLAIKGGLMLQAAVYPQHYDTSFGTVLNKLAQLTNLSLEFSKTTQEEG